MPEVAPIRLLEDPTVTALIADLGEQLGTAEAVVRDLLNQIWHCEGDLTAVRVRLLERDREVVADLLRADVLRQEQSRIEAYRYALARTALELLQPSFAGSQSRPYLGKVARAQRDSVLDTHGADGRRAAVAVPVVVPENGEPYFAVSRRSVVNGYDGGPMNNAGDVVLFGGSADSAEALAVTAIRELIEEAGLGADTSDLGFGVLECLSQWRTEAGHRAEGYLVDSPVELSSNVEFDTREVGDVGTIALHDLYAAHFDDRYHLGTITTSDRTAAAVGWFASPTALLGDRDGIRQWIIWGLAGVTLSNLVSRYPTVDSLLAAVSARRAAVHNRTYVPDYGEQRALDGFKHSAYRARSFMSEALGVGTAQIVRSPVLSEILDETSLLALDTGLGWGSSTKTRAICGYLYGLVESGMSGTARSAGGFAEVLRAKLDGAVLVVGSSGSHAFAVAQFTDWLRTRLGITVALEIFVAADVTPGKLRAIESRCDEVILAANFNAAIRAAQTRVGYLQSKGQRALLLTSDPEPVFNAQLAVSAMDPAIGLATLVLDLQRCIGTSYRELGLALPVIHELRMPTSGGATWASCAALLAAGLLDIGHDFELRSVTAAYDVAAPSILRALESGDPTVVTEVDWTNSINGLAQPEIALGAWSLLSSARSTDPALLHPVSASAARIGAAVVELETGVRVQLAAGAAVGSRLFATVAHSNSRQRRDVFAVLMRAGIDRVLDQPRKVFAAVEMEAHQADLAAATTGGTRCYLISGAEIDV